jgi:hypothetical protein
LGVIVILATAKLVNSVKTSNVTTFFLEMYMNGQNMGMIYSMSNRIC